ncbi:MAG TPA: histone deacetylase family protein [Candidatus Limnocylindria bacterium]
MADPAAPSPVIRSDAHLAHSGLVELLGGREIPCFESPERAIAIERALEADGRFSLEPPGAFGTDPILAVHEPSLLSVVREAWTDALAAGDADGSRPLIPDTFKLAPYAGPMEPLALPAGAHRRLGAMCFDTATPIVGGTAAAALAAVDVALTGATRVLGGARLAYGLCRPPGHHAARAMLGGYCFFNNAAIVAEWLRREAGFARVAILDVDYHHGNGTQQIFWERGDVLYVSLHADPARAFPYFSGFAAERGSGAGEGATHNFPLAAGTALEGYSAALDEALALVAAFAPDAPLVMSLGFDTFERDPIGDLALQTDDYGVIGRTVGGLGLPVLALQEGGYAVDALGANAVALLGGLREALIGS